MAIVALIKIVPGPTKGLQNADPCLFSQVVRRQYFNEENLFRFCQKNVTSEQSKQGCGPEPVNRNYSVKTEP